MTELITLEHVAYFYKIRNGLLRHMTFNALKDVTLDIHEGETLGLIGRNGAGKSTLLRLLARIYIPSRGTLRHARPNLSVSLLTLQLGFFAELSGRDNAIMGAMLMGYTRDEAEGRLDRIVEFSGLGQWMHEPLKTYSSGMRARLGFSVAMEMSPDVLLIDEVLGVGDVNFYEKSAARLKSKLASNQTVVLVSHSIPAIKELCTRVVWLEDGRIQMQGDPETVVNEYRKHAG